MCTSRRFPVRPPRRSVSWISAGESFSHRLDIAVNLSLIGTTSCRGHASQMLQASLVDQGTTVGHVWHWCGTLLLDRLGRALPRHLSVAAPGVVLSQSTRSVW